MVKFVDEFADVGESVNDAERLGTNSTQSSRVVPKPVKRRNKRVALSALKARPKTDVPRKVVSAASCNRDRSDRTPRSKGNT